MSSDLTPPNIQEITKKSEEIYNSLPKEDIEENEGKFIAIESTSGDYFFGETREDAVSLAKEKHPKKLIFVRKMGIVEKLSFHSSISFKQMNKHACLF